MIGKTIVQVFINSLKDNLENKVRKNKAGR